MTEIFYCPYPLAYGEETSAKVVYVFEQGNCALRCPTVTYTEKEWTILGAQAELMFIVALMGTCVIFFYQVHTSKMKAEFLPRIMFLLGFFLLSLIFVIFLSMNGREQDKITCDGDSGFVERSSFCVFQACSTIFFIIWIEMWSFFMAYENYLYICSALEQSSNHHGKNNKKYLVASFFVCSVCTAIPLFAGNLGFDYEANLPICLFLVSDNRNYLWGTLVAPFGLFGILCLVYTLLSIRKIQSIFVHSEDYLARSSAHTDGGVTDESSFQSSVKMSIVRGSGSKDHDNLDSNRDSVTLGSNPMHVPQSEGAKDSAADFDDVRGTQDISEAMNVNDSDMHNEPVFDYSMNSERPKPSFMRTAWSHIRRTWKYNGRQMVFFGSFCLLTLAIIPIIIYSYGTQFDYFVEGTEHFIECLIEAAAKLQATDPSATQESVDAYAESECGTVPSARPPTSLVSTAAICVFSYKFIYIYHHILSITYFVLCFRFSAWSAGSLPTALSRCSSTGSPATASRRCWLERAPAPTAASAYRRRKHVQPVQPVPPRAGQGRMQRGSRRTGPEAGTVYYYYYYNYTLICIHIQPIRLIWIHI
jgi:hypothetical protein